MNLTPFFPAWPHLSRRRSLPCLRRLPLPQLESLLGPLIPSPKLDPAARGTNSRERTYSLRLTFWAFLWQVLNPGSSCREVVRLIQALFGLQDQEVDEGTSAYCQARSRLPLSILQSLRAQAARTAEQRVPQDQSRWYGHEVSVVDGTTVSLPDTAPNQKKYPQSKSQKPGCGFPLLKLVGIFSLASGALRADARGNKHQHELSLLHGLWKGLLQAGDLLLGDRGFGDYATLALLGEKGVLGLFRLHQARRSDLRQGKRLGPQDRLLIWRKPWYRPRYLSQKIWKALPPTLTVRMVRFRIQERGFRSQQIVLITTLLDASRYPREALAALYRRRLRIELWFRDLKTTMGMEQMRCQSPQMVHKELEMYLLAYNLIRCLMGEAGVLHGVELERISFKGSVDTVRQYSGVIGAARTQKEKKRLVAQMLLGLARDTVPERPGRREPRAVKRRPKPYPLLNQPRHQYREILHRSRYRRQNSAKTNELI